MMTQQDFKEFQITVEGSAVSFSNQEDGSTIVTCDDDVKIYVSADGEVSYTI